MASVELIHSNEKINKKSVVEENVIEVWEEFNKISSFCGFNAMAIVWSEQNLGELS